VKDLNGVTKRIGILTSRLYGCPHLLKPILRPLVLEFNKRNCDAGFAGRLGTAFLTTLRTNASASDSEPAVVRSLPVDEKLRKRTVEDEHMMRLVI
jgi:hypothetical protein